MLISNADVQRAIGIGECIDALEIAYRELGEGLAIFRPRSVIRVPHAEASYSLATMDGVSRSAGVAAVRLRSDLSTLSDGRKTKYAGSPGTYCGLILLFDIQTGLPLAVLHDGLIQQMRVAATAAVAARRLSRLESKILGILGAGSQARSHVRAYTSILPIGRVLVHSPNPASGEAFAEEIAAELSVEVLSVRDPHDAVSKADVVATCTNSTRPVLAASWLRPGTHLSSVRHWAEIGPDTMDRVDRVVVHQLPEDTWYDLPAIEDNRTRPSPLEPRGHPVPADLPTLPDLVADSDLGRRSSSEVTYFLNNVGTGVQFAACAGAAYRSCLAVGLGTTLPDDLFLQTTPD